MIDAETAAEVAFRHGLSLRDAAALQSLADDEAAADQLAARFAGDSTDAAMRKVARRVFRGQPSGGAVTVDDDTDRRGIARALFPDTDA